MGSMLTVPNAASDLNIRYLFSCSPANFNCDHKLDGATEDVEVVVVLEEPLVRPDAWNDWFAPPWQL